MSSTKNGVAPKQQTPGRGQGPMGGGRGMMVEKPKDFKNSVKKLGKYLKPHLFSILLTLIFAALSTVFSIVSPKILGTMTNQIVDGYVSMKAYDSVLEQLPEGTILPEGTLGKDLLSQLPEDALEKIPSDQLDTIKEIDFGGERPSMRYDTLKDTALTLIKLYALSAIFGYLQGWIIAGVTQKVSRRLRREISQKINKLPISYFDEHSFGDILSRVTNDVGTIAQSLNQSLSQAVTSVASIVGIIVMMISISWQMTGVALLTIPLSTIFIAFVTKRTQKYFKKQQSILGKLNGQIEEVYSGHLIVKAFAGEERAIKEFTNTNNRLYNNAWKSQFFSGLMMPIMQFIGNIGYVATAVLGGWLAINNRVSIGDIQAFIQYVSQLNHPLVQAAQIANILQSTTAAAERVFDFLEENEEEKDPVDAKVLESVKGDISFNNVVFGYEPNKTVIKGFSAQIKPGQKVAIVGPTGAGKTTLVNLLMRFYDPNSGQITIDGINTKNITRASVRSKFGMVLQDTWLFNGTIRENLVYGKPNATDDEVKNAAKAAHIDHLIESMPKGYSAKIDESADNISQGEKQLITIARAMISDAPMLILDEATSSVDTRTEILIQNAMEKLSKDRTSFIIAHRLSTIRNADLILVVNDGNIVEQGTHKSLLKKNGFYADLYNSQFQET